jgi:hypothetical protein
VWEAGILPAADLPAGETPAFPTGWKPVLRLSPSLRETVYQLCERGAEIGAGAGDLTREAD